MVVAIDYDSTWSADPDLWQRFTQYARHRGHRVALVTNRPDNVWNREEVGKAVLPYVDHLIFAGPQSKRKAAALFGINPAIWIDDKPETVAQGLRL